MNEPRTPDVDMIDEGDWGAPPGPRTIVIRPKNRQALMLSRRQASALARRLIKVLTR